MGAPRFRLGLLRAPHNLHPFPRGQYPQLIPNHDIHILGFSNRFETQGITPLRFTRKAHRHLRRIHRGNLHLDPLRRTAFGISRIGLFFKLLQIRETILILILLRHLRIFWGKIVLQLPADLDAIIRDLRRVQRLHWLRLFRQKNQAAGYKYPVAFALILKTFFLSR